MADSGPPTSSSRKTTSRAKSCASRRRPSRCRSRCSSTTARPPSAYIRDYRDALPAFVTALLGDAAGAKHDIALIALGERPTILTDYTSDPARLQKGIDRVFASSGSGVYLLDGIIEVSQGITKRSNPRPVIVAIIDRGPELSDRHFRQVLDPLRTSGAALHVVTVGTPRNMEDDRNMVLDMGAETERGPATSTILLGTALTGRLKQLATS